MDCGSPLPLFFSAACCAGTRLPAETNLIWLMEEGDSSAGGWRQQAGCKKAAEGCRSRAPSSSTTPPGGRLGTTQTMKKVDNSSVTASPLGGVGTDESPPRSKKSKEGFARGCSVTPNIPVRRNRTGSRSDLRRCESSAHRLEAGEFGFTERKACLPCGAPRRCRGEAPGRG